jgi:hypothetical protein
VDHKTVTDWFNFLRDLCSADLLANPHQIGGQGRIVAIDESVVARAKRGKRACTPGSSSMGVWWDGSYHQAFLYGAGATS